MIKPLKALKDLQEQYFIAIDEAFKAKTVLGEKNFEEMREDLMNRYRIEREQLKKEAKIPDKNTDYITNLRIYELTPHRCGFLFLKLNETRKLLNKETTVENRSELDLRWEAVEQLEKELTTQKPEEPKEKRRSFWQRLFHKNDKRAAMESSSPSGSATSAQPSEPSNAAIGANSVSDAAREQLEEIIKQADKTPHAEAFDQPEPPTAPPTLDTPPAPVQPKGKPKKRRKPQAEPTAEPPTAPNASEQLTGQINIDDITNK